MADLDSLSAEDALVDGRRDEGNADDSPVSEAQFREGMREIKELLSRVIQKVSELEGDSRRSQPVPAEDWGPNEDLRKRASQAQNDAFEELERKGELLSARELARLRGVGESAITEARNVGRIFRVKLGKRYLYPRFFGEHPADPRDIEKVCQALGSLPGTVKWNFFTTPLWPLDGLSPLEAITKGKMDEAIKAAESAVEL